MWIHTFRRLVIFAAVVGGAVACGRDTATDPQSPMTVGPVPGGRVSSVLAAPATVVPLQRSASLPVNESATAVIGAAGGHLALPLAGLSVDVPPLAVLSPTIITVTALAGSDVAYEFSPHGLVFAAPVIAVQDLGATQAAAGGTINPLSLLVGYFANSNSVTQVTELFGVDVDVAGQTSTVALPHFSGYVWSSGRGDDQDVDGGLGGTTTVRRPSRPSATARVPSKF